MAFGNMSESDRFDRGIKKKDEVPGSNHDDLEKYNPDFKTAGQGLFGDEAPTLEELENDKTRKIKAPHDRYHHADLKEILKIRSAFIIIGLWVITYVLLKIFAHGDPNNWYSMQFDPDHMPGFLQLLGQGGGLLSYVAGIIQIVLGAILSPLMFISWWQFILNAIVVMVFCWSAKFVTIDDMRLVKSYLLSAMGGSLVTYGLFRVVMLAFTLTGVATNTWVQAMEAQPIGYYGLSIGIVGLWIFTLTQVMFERSEISEYDEEHQKTRKQRTGILLLVIILGVLYILFGALPEVRLLPIKPLRVFGYLVLIVSLVIGLIRGLMSYSTIAMARQRARL